MDSSNMFDSKHVRRQLCVALRVPFLEKNNIIAFSHAVGMIL